MIAIHTAKQPIHEVSPPHLHPYHLGASLYMPATRHDIWQIITRQKIPAIHSIILCLEDAVLEQDVPTALANVQNLLTLWQDNPPACRPLVFIRPRNAKMLQALGEFKHIALIDGFVLPKVDMFSLADWRWACQNLPKTHFLMPTLETAPIFGAAHNQELANAFTEGFDQQILAVRVGGNDLLSCLRMRRLPHVTLYQSPLGTLLYQLLGTFVPQGFYLSSPVFEFLDKGELLAQELAQDVALGLVGKTVIHPVQIGAVTNAFKVARQDHSQALAILDSSAKAVFKQDNTMLEPATHKNWAIEIVERGKVFGVGD